MHQFIAHPSTGAVPGQRMMHGARIDPSREVKYAPRQGSDTPVHSPPNGSGSPAGSRQFGSASLSEAHTYEGVLGDA